VSSRAQEVADGVNGSFSEGRVSLSKVQNMQIVPTGAGSICFLLPNDISIYYGLLLGDIFAYCLTTFLIIIILILKFITFIGLEAWFKW
jgi:hypothetical protein